MVTGSSYSKITTQNIPPGYVRTTLEEKTETVASNDGRSAQSQDLNPVELVWDELNRRLKQSNLQVQHICGITFDLYRRKKQQFNQERKKLDLLLLR